MSVRFALPMVALLLGINSCAADVSTSAAGGAQGGASTAGNSSGSKALGMAGVTSSAIADASGSSGQGGANGADALSATPDAAPIDSSKAVELVHPGALHTESDLERIRTGVASGSQPWGAAFSAIKNSDAGTSYQPHVSATISDAYALQDQGHAAYVLAIKWVASGDMGYATAARRILDAWVDTVQTMNTDTLRTGIGANQMANAAEILAHGFNGAAGWPAANISKAQSWFKTVVWPRIGAANAQRSSNWGTSAMAGCMATAIFSDDPSKFDYAVSAFKNGFTDAPDGCSGVTQYICNSNGQPTEAGRDQGHAQGGVGHLVETAMMAHNQGENLVVYTGDRVVAGMEYLAKYNLGNDVPYDPNFADPCNVHPAWPVISPIGRGAFSPIYEVANKLFGLAGVAHPYTAQVVASPGYEPEKTNSDHPGLGTLTAR